MFEYFQCTGGTGLIFTAFVPDSGSLPHMLFKSY